MKQNASDYLESLGSTLGKIDLPNRRYTSPFLTGASSALVGFGEGIKTRRAMEEARNLKAQRDAFQQKVGISFDLFSKMSGKAQDEILRASGMLSEPGSTPLSDFGGRTLTQLQNEGAPSKESMAAPTGAFEGLASAPVQTGPSLPPLNALGAGQRGPAINRYLGIEDPLDPNKQSLIDYRTKRLSQIDQEIKNRERFRQKQGRGIDLLNKSRESKEAPVPDWMLKAGRRMGLMLPPSGKVSRTDFDRMMKFNKPAQATIQRIGDLVDGARKVETELGKEMTDEQIARYVKQQTTELGALAGPNAGAIVLEAVKSQLQDLRAASKFFDDSNDSQDDNIDEGDLPPELDDNDDDYMNEDDQDSDDQDVPGR